jgi:hypothetical protein
MYTYQSKEAPLNAPLNITGLFRLDFLSAAGLRQDVLICWSAAATIVSIVRGP